MIVLDVDDELGERLELESAAPEPAGIGEERSGGDARHVHGAGAFTGQRGGGGGPGAGVVNEEAEVSGPGIGTGQSAEQRSRHRAARQDSGGRSGEAGGAVGGGGGGVAGGIRHDLPTCWYHSRTDCGVVSKISLILAHIHTL